MGKYTADILVAVYPFTRQIDGEEIVIGNPNTAVFLVLPTDAVELLDYLAAGKTVGEAQLIYEEKYGEAPNLEDLLDTLERKGFVQPLFLETDSPSSNIEKIFLTRSNQPPQIRFQFANFPQYLARRLFSKTVLISCSSLIALAITAICLEPSIFPTWQAYFFTENVTLTVLVVMILNCVTVFIHEMAHLIAARAVGVSCRMGISNRMWVLVAETDMTGIWSVKRNQRYLPFIAGPLVDAVSAAILILLFFIAHHGWIVLHPVVTLLGRAMLLNYLLGIVWQCYFFMRTDFYYITANFFRCKSLLKDTETFLLNQVARFCRWIATVNQSHIPAKEMRVIRYYAILYIVGRITALGYFIFISMPLMWHYFFSLFRVLVVGYFANPYAFIDALLMILLIFLPQGIGFWLWIRSFRSFRSLQR